MGFFLKKSCLHSESAALEQTGFGELFAWINLDTHIIDLTHVALSKQEIHWSETAALAFPCGEFVKSTTLSSNWAEFTTVQTDQEDAVWEISCGYWHPSPIYLLLCLSKNGTLNICYKPTSAANKYKATDIIYIFLSGEIQTHFHQLSIWIPTTPGNLHLQLGLNNTGVPMRVIEESPLSHSHIIQVLPLLLAAVLCKDV